MSPAWIGYWIFLAVAVVTTAGVLLTFLRTRDPQIARAYRRFAVTALLSASASWTCAQFLPAQLPPGP